MHSVHSWPRSVIRNDEDQKYRCLCYVHVQTAAKVVALIGCIICFGLALIAKFVGPRESVDGILIPILVFYGLLHFSILYAQKNRQPALYLPYLIINGIALFFWFVVFFGLFTKLLLLLFDEVYVKHPEENVRLIAGLTPLVGLIAVVSAWFYSLVWRAWRFLQEEIAREKLVQSGIATVPQIQIYGVTLDGITVPLSFLSLSRNSNAVYPALNQPIPVIGGSP